MATYTDQPTFTTIVATRCPAVAAGADAESAVCRVPSAGVVTSVNYVPDAAITGAATNYRSLIVRNKGQAGSGTTVVAQKDFVNAVNAPAYDETAITNSGTAANLDVAAGDILSFYSLHVGTGIADPGGLVVITLTRT